jgi:hypothetical protein
VAGKPLWNGIGADFAQSIMLSRGLCSGLH